ncbi:MAG: hypothetical protein LBQ64_04450 [Bacteroidales bacterium]|jgi:hypothetical protein|nr:hypothetical protein [Bacteroidales bacterium]
MENISIQSDFIFVAYTAGWDRYAIKNDEQRGQRHRRGSNGVIGKEKFSADSKLKEMLDTAKFTKV